MEKANVSSDTLVTKKEARKITKLRQNKIVNEKITSFVSLKDINKIYPNGVQAVYDFNLEIDHNDFVVLVGPSGCGKTTTLRMIAGLESITSGYLYIDRILSNYLESKNRDISMVFQSYALYPQLTVYDNIAFPLKVRKYPKVHVSEALKNSQEILDALASYNNLSNALINAYNLKEKKISKVRYIARAMNIHLNAAKFLFNNTSALVDEFSLKKDELIASAKEKIEKEEEKLRANNIKWNEKYEITSDGSKKDKVNSVLLRNLELIKLLSESYKEVLSVLDDAYDPKAKVRKKDNFIAKKLKINLETASFISSNRVSLIKNDEKQIKELIAKLKEEMEKEKSKVLSSGLSINEHYEIVSTTESKKPIVNQVLKKNNDIVNVLVKHYEEFKEDVANRTSYKDIAKKYDVGIDAVTYLLSFKIFSKKTIDSKIASISKDISSKMNMEKIKLKGKGIKINDKFEILDENDNPKTIYVKLNKEEIREKVFHAANILDLGPYLDRRPKELSGGQMQRVALGRAIVRNAKLFLMDEPLSNLDAKLRVAMRSEIVLLHERIGATTIYVTHDQTEAMTMATKIVVMSKGWIQQVGVPQYIYDHPANLFVATFIGSPAMNIIEGKVSKNTVTLSDGFKIDLGTKFTSIHNEFYKKKIAECEKMLITLNKTMEVQCLNILNYIYSLTSEFAKKKDEILENFNFMLKKMEESQKDSKDNLVKATKQAINFTKDAKEYTSDVSETYSIVSGLLKNYESIHQSDIAKIFSQQAYEKENKEKDQVKELTYEGRKKENIFTKIQDKIKSLQASFKAPELNIDNPYDYLTNLKKKYEEALKGAHEIKIGIRPENVHLYSEYTKKTKSSSFKVKVDVVEVMGNEIVLHAPFNNVDFIGKITAGMTSIKAHDTVELCFNVAKMHVFDIYSGETII